jgi:cytochrome c2
MLLGWRALLVPGLLLALAGCDDAAPPPHLQVAGGDPERGRAAIASYGCGSCHAIPGVPGAEGTVGPPLADFALRGYVAGVVPNWPGYLVRWVMDPPAISPQTAMPNVGVDEQEARDIAAYLYTLGAERAAAHPPEPLPPLAPPDELQALRAAEDRLLGEYGWVGEDEVRIPIERAMELLLEREAGAPEPPAQ